MVAKLVGSGIILIFMGVGFLSYIDTANDAWDELWQELAHKKAPFKIGDPSYGWIVIGLGFALFGVAYLFRNI